MIGRPEHRGALQHADAPALPLQHRWFARLLQCGACARMRNAELIQPRDRRQDRGGAVIDVIGDADRINARNFQRLGRRKRGKESLAVERVRGARLVETTLEIAEDEIGRLELRRDLRERSLRVRDIHQVDVAGEKNFQDHADGNPVGWILRYDGTRANRARHHSALILAARITLPHFSVSSAMSLPKSSGVPPSAVAPSSANRAFILGSARSALISLLSLSTIAAGVFLGAPMPKLTLAS